MISLLALPAAITIGPASLSLPELAAALTKAGIRAEASVPLQSRAAFVCFKNRSPEEVKKVLGEALGLIFEPRKNGLLIVPDPEAKERDRRMLVAYTKLAGKEIRTWMGERQKRLGSGSYETLVQSTKAAAEEVQGKDIPVEELRSMVDRMILLQPEQWNVVRQNSLASTLPNAVYGERKEWMPFAATGLPPIVYVPDHEDTVIPPEAPVEFRMKFDPAEGVFTVTNSITLAGYGRSGRQSLSLQTKKLSLMVGQGEGGVPIPVETDGVAASFDRLGPEAKAYLATLTPRAELPDKEPPQDLPPSYISVALERFGHEGVMELSPRFEDVPRGQMWQSPGALSPKALFTPVAPRAVPGFDPISSVYPTKETEAALALRAERRFPLRVVDRNGIWMVANPYRFLDHAQFISPVPFLRAERILAEVPDEAPRDFGGNLMPTWNLAVRLYRAMRPETTLRETQKSFNYRGVSLHESSLLEPLIPAVEALIPEVRKAFWKTLATKGKATLNDQNGPIEITASKFSTGPDSPKGSYQIDAKRFTGTKFINITAFMDGRGSLVP
ncbi:hypothetical protein EON81_09560 [bacterium]|nr:MAG: hypothetical protein EON81_09560 [bacterium]